MDGFSYINIFATKGIEYIIIISFFILLVPFWLMLNKKEEIKVKMTQALTALREKLLVIPKGLLFGENHTWTFMNKSGVAIIGVSDLLQKITGETHIEYLKSPDESIVKGDAIAKLWNESKYLTITSPVSGKMTSINSDLITNPSLINADPYRKGWFIKMEPSHWLNEISDLKVAENASTWMKSELKRFKEFLPFSMSNHSPELQSVALQDGGELMEYPLMELSEPVWNDFQKSFLD